MKTEKLDQEEKFDLVFKADEIKVSKVEEVIFTIEDLQYYFYVGDRLDLIDLQDEQNQHSLPNKLFLKINAYIFV